jgi:hypothetical protein
MRRPYQGGYFPEKDMPFPLLRAFSQSFSIKMGKQRPFL